MAVMGGHPVLSMSFNTTIAASALGTAAATALNSSFPATNATYMQIYNMTSRDLELIIGSADPGTAVNTSGIIYVPGNETSPGVTAIQGHLMPINIQSGMKILARTTTNVPLTVSSTALPLRINFWA